MALFQMGGVSYESGSLTGMQKILLTKRLMPLALALGGAVPEFAALGTIESEAQDGADAIPLSDAAQAEKLGIISDALMPAARELAAMRDEDLTFILDVCMDATKRQMANGVGWVPVRQNGYVQDRNDDTLKSRLTIAMHVVAENFSETCASLGFDVQGIATNAKRLVAKQVTRA